MSRIAIDSALLEQLKAQLAATLAYLQSLREPTGVQPLVLRKALEVVNEMTKRGYNVTIYQSFRSKAEQDAIYAQGRTKPGAIVTNAKGGESLHNYGVAVDIVFVVNGKPSWSDKHAWAELGSVGKSVGFEWGGDWKGFVDRPHFQLTLGHSLSDFQKGRVDYRKYL
jgi:peptidoglycan L-alanyl-D-glutamate endopeptidase CwlK